MVARREACVPLRPVVDPAAWHGADMACSTDWIRELSGDEIAEIDAAVAGIQERDIAVIDIRREDFPLPALGQALEGIRDDDLLDGRGFAVIRGVPVERYTLVQSCIAFLGIGIHLGVPVSQNAKGHLIGHVRDVGHSQKNPGQRAYQTSESVPFHIDACDVIGLICLRRGASGGASTIASAVAIHNEMLRRRPDLAAALAKPFCMDRREEIPEGKKPWYEIPVFSYHEGFFSSFAPGANVPLAQRHPEVPRLTPEDRAAIDMFGVLADELKLMIDFRRGDIQYLNNHVITHARSAYTDHPEPERKRHLLRILLATPAGRPLTRAYYDRYDPKAEHGRPFGIFTKDTVATVPLEPE